MKKNIKGITKNIINNVQKRADSESIPIAKKIHTFFNLLKILLICKSILELFVLILLASKAFLLYSLTISLSSGTLITFILEFFLPPHFSTHKEQILSPLFVTIVPIPQFVLQTAHLPSIFTPFSLKLTSQFTDFSIFMDSPL